MTWREGYPHTASAGRQDRDRRAGQEDQHSGDLRRGRRLVKNHGAEHYAALFL